jgi:hypothetical protein
MQFGDPRHVWSPGENRQGDYPRRWLQSIAAQAIALASLMRFRHNFSGQGASFSVEDAGMDSVRPSHAYPICEEIGAGDSKSFEQLYAIYAEMFPLPDEREPPEAFYEIYALNKNADIQKRLGPWREVVAAIRLEKSGPVVGGHVFGVTTSPAHRSFGCRASVQAIYTFLDKDSRGRGGIADADKYMMRTALETFGFEDDESALPPLIFSEVNNPLRMTAHEIEQDTLHSGIDPYRRYRFWRRTGFAPLDFTYVQPALRSGAEPVRYLDLFCAAGTHTGIPAELIAAHLAPFISISVLKGRPASEDDQFLRMRDALKPGAIVPFVPDTHADQIKIRQGADAARRKAGTNNAPG